MKSVQHYIEQYRVTAQYAIPHEQVLAVGLLSRPGSMKSMAVSQFSPLVGMIMRHRQKKRAAGFPLSVLVAVTPTRLVVFQYRPRGTSVKITRTVAEWPRYVLGIETGTPGAHSRLLRFSLPDGTSVELESARSLGQYSHMNDPFYACLGLAVPV